MDAACIACGAGLELLWLLSCHLPWNRAYLNKLVYESTRGAPSGKSDELLDDSNIDLGVQGAVCDLSNVLNPLQVLIIFILYI